MSRLSLNLDTPELARHYESASADRQFKHGQLLLEKLGIKAGQQLLDVGCGTGLLAEYAAGLVGPQGAVHAIDPLPLRIELAQRRAKPNLYFRVGDARDLSAFASATFDVVYLNAVFHWLPEKLSPLREFFRVLKPGGRLGITTGSKEHENSLQAIRSQVLAREPYRQYPEAEAGVAFRVSATELRNLLNQARFGVESLELQPNHQLHANASAAILFSQASSFGNFLGHLPATLRQQAEAEIETELNALRTAEGIPQVGARIIALAVKDG